MRYKERRPNYFTGYDDGEFEVDTFDHLAKLDCVAGRFAQGENFLKFSWTDGYTEDYPYCLMAELKDGKFWVTGYISDKLDLPRWSYEECTQRKNATGKT